jgi:hypothetical protein
VLAAVVDTVSVPEPAPAPLMTTGEVVPKLGTGRLTAPLGLDVTAAVNATLPVNPPLGVTVIVVLFPVVAPFATVSEATPGVSPNPAAEVTVWVAVAGLATVKLVSPE